MMGFERFDVVTALFPFIDMPLRKPRPALVLSTAAFNAPHGHVIGAMITTGARSLGQATTSFSTLTRPG